MTREALEHQLMEATWETLAPHQSRGALLLASSDLDLVDVGLAIANDDAAMVQTWLGEGRLRKCTETQAGDYRILIVQPFVLVQGL